jgi:Na+-driven multidrug efflux pump
MQDVRSPLYVLAAAAIVNFLGDMIFVGMKNPWFGGAAGAAWATVFSQYAAVWFFVRWLCTKPKPQAPQKAVNLTKAIMELTGEKDTRGKGRRSRFSEAVKSFAQSTPLPGLSSAAKVASVTKKLQKKPKACKPEAKVESVSTRGFLYGKFRGVDLLKLPNKERAQEYAPYLLPVTTTQFGRVSAYIAMSHVVASTLGTSAMAAQQVIVSLFYCFTPIFDSLSLTAQSMVPRLAEKRHSRARANALRSTMRNFFKAGGICGAVMVGAVTCVPLLSSFFTSDPGVVALVNSVAPLLVAFFVVHGIFMGSEGMLLAQKDLNFIGKSYAAFFFAVPYFMLRLKRAALGGNTGITLTSVWSIFVMYQYVRLFTFVGRNFIMQRRSNRNADKAEQSLLL